MSLPIFKDENKNLMLMETAWSSAINPFLSNPVNQTNILKSVVLVSGDNTISHKLGRTLQGWFVVGQNASATFFDKQANNPTPNQTLILNASGAVTINLGVF